MRFAFDTNVIVSAVLFPESVPGMALFGARRRGKVVVSPALVKELKDVLAREKFTKYVTREERERFLVALLRESELVEPASEFAVCRDPTDDRLLELAVDAGASFLVTGDRDLLALHPFRGVHIVTPAQMVEMLSQM